MLWSSSSSGPAGEGARGAGRRPLGALASRLLPLPDPADMNLLEEVARVDGDLERALFSFRSSFTLMGLMINESSPTAKSSGDPDTPKGVVVTAMAVDPDGPSDTIELTFGILAALP